MENFYSDQQINDNEPKTTSKTKVYAWGNGKFGNLGNGSDDYEALPYNVKQLNNKGIVKVQCGEWFCLALSANGTLYGWGKWSRSRFGMTSPNDMITTPVVIPLKIKVKSFACGYWHSLLIWNSGFVYSWGDNKKGALGLAHTDNVSEFTKISDFENVEKVAAGSGFSLFVNTDGNLFSWGWKTANGQSKKGDVTVPTEIKSIEEPVTYIDWGVEHAAAITSSGSLYTWGANSFNQLGHGSKFSSTKVQGTPKIVSSLEGVNVINVSCSKGLKHCQTAWTDSEGNAYFWGWGYKGKLGNIDNWNHERDCDEATPKRIKFENVTWAISGGIHSSIIVDDGILYTFGCGSHGRLGHQKYIDGKYRHLYKESQPKKVEAIEEVGKVVDYTSTYSSNVALVWLK